MSSWHSRYFPLLTIIKITQILSQKIFCQVGFFIYISAFEDIEAGSHKSVAEVKLQKKALFLAKELGKKIKHYYLNFDLVI